MLWWLKEESLWIWGFPHQLWNAGAEWSLCAFSVFSSSCVNRLVLVFYFTCFLMFLFSPFSLKKRKFFFFFFLPPTLLFSLFLFSFFVFSLFPSCSLDAAKRKAWKLNRVGSLRNIYSSSSTNTEGNKPTRPRQTPPLSPPLDFIPLLQNFALLASSVPFPLEMRFAPSMRVCFHPVFAESFHLVFSSFCSCLLFCHSCSFQLT